MTRASIDVFAFASAFQARGAHDLAARAKALGNRLAAAEDAAHELASIGERIVESAWDDSDVAVSARELAAVHMGVGAVGLARTLGVVDATTQRLSVVRTAPLARAEEREDVVAVETMERRGLL
ncbi:MAG: hypothetical protein ACRC4O_10280 [Giesbergeria sp.]